VKPETRVSGDGFGVGTRSHSGSAAAPKVGSGRASESDAGLCEGVAGSTASWLGASPGAGLRRGGVGVGVEVGVGEGVGVMLGDGVGFAEGLGVGDGVGVGVADGVGLGLGGGGGVGVGSGVGVSEITGRSGSVGAPISGSRAACATASDTSRVIATLARLANTGAVRRGGSRGSMRRHRRAAQRFLRERRNSPSIGASCQRHFRTGKPRSEPQLPREVRAGAEAFRRCVGPFSPSFRSRAAMCRGFPWPAWA
jgi:hypothetical protein